MKKLIAALILMVSLTGCQSFGSEFVAGVEEKVRLRWAEEWGPAMEAKLETALDDARDSVLAQTQAQIELQEEKTRADLERVNVRLESFDQDGDGKVTGMESAQLVAALKAARDEDGKPLDWYQILMAVILGYGGTTAGKEWVKSKMKGTGDGTQTA